jgi:hypothetical protein
MRLLEESFDGAQTPEQNKIAALEAELARMRQRLTETEENQVGELVLGKRAGNRGIFMGIWEPLSRDRKPTTGKAYLVFAAPAQGLVRLRGRQGCARWGYWKDNLNAFFGQGLGDRHEIASNGI